MTHQMDLQSTKFRKSLMTKKDDVQIGILVVFNDI